MKSTTLKKTFSSLLVFCLSISLAWAQSPDDFLDESDFDSEPPGTFVPPPPDFGGPNDFNPPPPVDIPPSSTFTPPPPTGGSGSTVNRSTRNRARRPINEAISDEITNENYPDLLDSFDYPNAEIADVIKAISELTGKNFIVDPNVRGKITIMAPSKITVAEAYKAFLSALAINGFSVVPSGKFLKVKPARDAQKDSIETYSGAYSPDTDQMITRIVHLKHISATEVNNKLRGLVTKYGDLNVYEPTNSVIISDFGSNVDKIMNIIKELDVAGFEEQLEVIRIKHAKAKDIAELMDKIINKGNTTPSRPTPGGGFTAGIPRFGGVQNQRGGGGAADAFSLVIPDERTNSIIVVGNKAGIQKIKDLVGKLDRRVTADEAGGVYVYYVKHSDAESISKTLNGLATESNKQTKAPSMPPSPFAPPVEQTQPLFGGEVKIGFNAETNSLIITASRQDYQVVLNLLRKIDIPRDQVFVEAIILEMNLGNSNQWGINYYKFIGDNDKNVVARAAGFGNGNLGSLLTGPGAILGFAQGETLKFNLGGQNVNVKDTMGFVNFLKRVGNVNILSTPQLLAMDNQEAEISVGDKIATGSATTPLGNTTNVSSSPTFEDLEIKLKIKPRISKTDNTIRLELDQSVKQLSNLQNPSETLAQNTVGVAKRALKTNISLTSGDTAVLGGLMQDQEITNEEKVPLLGDIPILGWLFKSKNKNIQKTNMLVLLTPHILRNAHDRNKLLDRKLTERVQFLRDSNGGRDPYGRQLEAIHRKADMAINKEESATTETEPGIQE